MNRSAKEDASYPQLPSSNLSLTFLTSKTSLKIDTEEMNDARSQTELVEGIYGTMSHRNRSRLSLQVSPLCTLVSFVVKVLNLEPYELSSYDLRR